MIESPTYGSNFEFTAIGNVLQQGDSYFFTIPYGVNNLIVSADLKYEHMPSSQGETFYDEVRNLNGTGVFYCQDALLGMYNNVPFYYVDSSYSIESPNSFAASINARTDQSSQILNWKGCFTYTGGIQQIAEGQTYSKGDVMIGSGTTGNLPYHMSYYRWATEDFTVDEDNIADDAPDYTSTDYPFDLLYPVNINIKPKVSINEFRNSVYSRHIVGQNQLAWEPITAELKGLTNAQARALLLFLETRHGIYHINLTLPAPYDKITQYLAPSWTHAMEAYDVNRINVTLVPEPRSYNDG